MTKSSFPSWIAKEHTETKPTETKSSFPSWFVLKSAEDKKTTTSNFEIEASITEGVPSANVGGSYANNIDDDTMVTIKHSLGVGSNNRPCHKATTSITHNIDNHNNFNISFEHHIRTGSKSTKQFNAAYNHKLQFGNGGTGNLSFNASISRNKPSFSLKGRFDL